MSCDVTEGVAAGIDAWILRKKRKQGSAYLTFHSREDAADLRDPTRAPTLLLERCAGRLAASGAGARSSEGRCKVQ
jgi:hypothetical protein